MRKKNITNLKQKKLNYNKLLGRLKKVKSLGLINKLITSYTRQNDYIPTTRTTNGYGDCNGDGGVNILDVVILINFILGDGDPPFTPYDNIVLEKCAVRFSDEGTLQSSGLDYVNILDVVNLISFILQNDENPDYSEEIPDLDLVISDDELGDNVYDTQSSYYGTQNIDLTLDLDPYDFEFSEFTPPLTNTVLITAPHGQRVFRSTVWNDDSITGIPNNPSEGLYHCSSIFDESCHKSADSCTGAMAKVLSDISGAPYISARYKQEDPNYYDILGQDLDGYYSESNVGSGNTADPASGIFDYNGMQTNGVFATGNLHPFKQKITDILNSNPNIKLVIDLHGASATSNHWDLDFGVLGDNGPDGTLNLPQVDIPTNTIDYELLEIMTDTLKNHGIGMCDYDCTTLSDCEKYSSNCPPGHTGHGPISYNDFAGRLQDTVTKYVNENHPGVHAVQLEASAIYRCLGSSNPNDVVRYMRALQEIIHLANIYYYES